MARRRDGRWKMRGRVEEDEEEKNRWRRGGRVTRGRSRSNWKGKRR